MTADGRAALEAENARLRTLVDAATRFERPLPGGRPLTIEPGLHGTWDVHAGITVLGTRDDPSSAMALADTIAEQTPLDGWEIPT